MHDAILARLGNSPWVNALVVYWNPFPAKRFRERNVTYLHGSELQTYVEELAAVLDPKTQAAVFGAVETLDTLDMADAA